MIPEFIPGYTFKGLKVSCQDRTELYQDLLIFGGVGRVGAKRRIEALPAARPGAVLISTGSTQGFRYAFGYSINTCLQARNLKTPWAVQGLSISGLKVG
jgi:hypothetical protein